MDPESDGLSASAAPIPRSNDTSADGLAPDGKIEGPGQRSPLNRTGRRGRSIH
jgi:hypothetical protein